MDSWERAFSGTAIFKEGQVPQFVRKHGPLLLFAAYLVLVLRSRAFSLAGNHRSACDRRRPGGVDGRQ
jgi:hypothetical protein